MVSFSPVAGAGWQFFDDNGDPLSGGKLYTYAAGTTTPAATYTDSTGSVPNTNPIILDAAGRVSSEVWFTSGALYKLVLRTSTNTDVWTKDNIPGIVITELSGASLISYNPPYTGAVTSNYTVQDRLAQFASVKDFGAVGDGVTDDTAALQTAINSGRDLLFPAGTYKANNLIGSTNFQRFYAFGQVNITKNANGVLFAHSGNYVELNGLQFNGDNSSPTFTGDNIVMTGSNPRLINCGSQYAYGRALYATGNHVQIIGTCGIYSTANTGAGNYDIEIGISGTATLYHQLYGVYTSTATGGVKLIDTGSHVLSGGQIGKLWIAAGTTPAGTNGGMTSNARIIGTVLVELSNSVFTGNQFGTQTVTFASGTSGHICDASNFSSGITLVNNANSSSNIVVSVGTGSPTGIIYNYGSSNCQIRYDSNLVAFTNQNVALANNKALQWFNTTNTPLNGVSLSSGDDWFFGGDSGLNNFTLVGSGSQGVYLAPSNTSAFLATSNVFRPMTDGLSNLGAVSNRFNTVYATTGTINTSDAREKTDVRTLTEAEMRVAKSVRLLLRAYKWRQDVSVNGTAAKIHFGVIAQEVIQAFAAEGLDALDYGVVDHARWGAAPAVERDGVIVEQAREAGERYGVRYDQLLAFVIGAM